MEKLLEQMKIAASNLIQARHAFNVAQSQYDNALKRFAAEGEQVEKKLAESGDE
jgi:hypothetical protein